jgi:L-threonylcarbamoyladenylate synthase
MIEKAAEVIKSGGVVAFPTETVYGLGADATNEEACSKIFRIKGRPSINPLIVHVHNIQQAESIAQFNEDAYKLCKQFWPGPLTIVLDLLKGHNIASIVLAGLRTIAVRMPSHPLALELIERSGAYIAAPSANPSGYISATALSHVREHFTSQEVYFLEPSSLLSAASNSLSIANKYNQFKELIGLESTIIDLSSSEPAILRHGFITIESLELVLEKKVKISNSLMAIKAPGMLEKHYSPNSKLRINATKLAVSEIGLNFGGSKLDSNYNLNLSETGDLIEAAANLYSMLRILDNYAMRNSATISAEKDSQDSITIAVAPIPESNIGLAINDKLKRAAYL